MLWGDYYFNREERKFTRQASKDYNKRAFVEFIMAPLYKMMARSISHEKAELAPLLAKLGVYLKNEDYRLNTKALMKKVCRGFFGSPRCFTDMVERFLPSPAAAAKDRALRLYSGDKTTKSFEQIAKHSKDGPLVVEVVKLYHREDCRSFDCLGRVVSGKISRGMRVKVLGPTYSLENEEDLAIKEISSLSLLCARYKIDIREGHPGNWVLIEGIDETISKGATLVDASYDVDKIEIFRPVKFESPSFVRLAIEPLIPSDLPKMLDGLRLVSKSYPLLETKIEESGEHLLVGTGEIYLDSVMHDLRNLYGEVEIKVSDPCVIFNETVIDTSSITCSGTTPNKLNKLSMIAEPLDKGLATEIEKEHIDLSWEKKRVTSFFTEKYNWDVLASSSVWSFGPTDTGPNVLLDYSLPGETDKAALNLLQDSVVQGFQWACKEGPLCEEPLRGVKFKLLQAEVASDIFGRAPGQIIPTTRRTCYASYLMASPRLLEPQLITEILCTEDSLTAVYGVINKRRGHLVKEIAKPGTPLYTVRATIPALDSFGFETDIRSHTIGQAFPLSSFDTWALLPGDPLDKSIKLTPLEPAPPSSLGREVLLKTRRRKGLNEEVSILNYFDDPNILELLKREQANLFNTANH